MDDQLLKRLISLNTTPVIEEFSQRRAFYRCSSLPSTQLFNNITAVHNGAFANCSSLTNTVLPGKISRIESNCFRLLLLIISIHNTSYFRVPILPFLPTLPLHCCHLRHLLRHRFQARGQVPSSSRSGFSSPSLSDRHCRPLNRFRFPSISVTVSGKSTDVTFLRSSGSLSSSMRSLYPMWVIVDRLDKD